MPKQTVLLAERSREEFLWQNQWEYKRKEAWEMRKELGTIVDILLKVGSKVLCEEGGRGGRQGKKHKNSF